MPTKRERGVRVETTGQTERRRRRKKRRRRRRRKIEMYAYLSKRREHGHRSAQCKGGRRPRRLQPQQGLPPRLVPHEEGFLKRS